MADLKHTPGPWFEYGPDDASVYMTSDEGDERVVCDCYVSRFPGSLGEASANARLIAAAPDLLEAARKAKAALLMFGHIEPMPSWLEEAFKAMVAAIRKAEGE